MFVGEVTWYESEEILVKHTSGKIELSFYSCHRYLQNHVLGKGNQWASSQSTKGKKCYKGMLIS